jgi:hypothetical protein
MVHIAHAAMVVLGCITLLACAPTAQPPASNESPSAAVSSGPAAFTRAMQPRLQAAVGAGGQVRIRDVLTLDLQRANSGPMAANLDRIWNYCQRVPAGCDAAVDEFTRGMAAHFATAGAGIEPSIATLRLVVRPADYVQQVRSAGLEPLAQPLAGDLMLVLVNDLPRSVQVMNATRIAQLGLSEAQAFAAARRNTSAALAPLAQVATPLPLPPNGIATLGGDPFYESSRLADAPSWAPIARGARGQLIAIAPDVGTIIYLDSAQPGGVEALRELAARIGRQSQRPLPPAILAWTPRGWQPFTPPAPLPPDARRT